MFNSTYTKKIGAKNNGEKDGKAFYKWINNAL